MAEGQESPHSDARRRDQLEPVASFESSLDELEKVVKELESGDLALDRSLDLFSRGMQLSESCRRQLEDAETRVEQLIRKQGAYQPEPFLPEK
jgi:exodeoxyribonuclease VII small subunit